MSAPSHNTINESYRFEALFNYASMGIVVVNGKGVIQSANPFALNLFEYPIEDLVGKPIELLIPQRYHHKHVTNRQSYTDNPKNRPMGVGMDLYAVKKNGLEFPVEVSLSNFVDNGERNVIAFVSDISIRKKAEAEIEKLNDELEITVQQRTKDLKEAMEQLEAALKKEKELGELKSRFVTMASHEFRTPLSTVLSSTYLIEKYGGTEDQPKREKHLQRIVSSVKMLTDILNDFLSVGKIEEGKIQVRLVDLNIRELVLAITSELNTHLKKGQQIQYSHEGDPIVYMDSSLVKHIIMNLLSNAIKFSPEESEIVVTTRNIENAMIISVRDKGIGISTEDQQHLMERFFRGTNASTIQGTGLGLHIVSKYAELMNGSVECKSELGRGTEFIITFNTKLPLYEEDPGYRG